MSCSWNFVFIQVLCRRKENILGFLSYSKLKYWVCQWGTRLTPFVLHLRMFCCEPKCIWKHLLKFGWLSFPLIQAWDWLSPSNRSQKGLFPHSSGNPFTQVHLRYSFIKPCGGFSNFKCVQCLGFYFGSSGNFCNSTRRKRLRMTVLWSNWGSFLLSCRFWKELTSRMTPIALLPVMSAPFPVVFSVLTLFPVSHFLMAVSNVFGVGLLTSTCNLTMSRVVLKKTTNKRVGV